MHGDNSLLLIVLLVLRQIILTNAETIFFSFAQDFNLHLN